jgi:hypothetical protein
MPNANFSSELLSSSTCQEMKEKKTWQENCPVSLDRLRCVTFAYYDFEGTEHSSGEIVVLDAVAKRTLLIFKQLHSIRFPIAKAYRIEHYKGNDEVSMADNNTSCFNCREITGGGLPSIHSYGLAIDVNPIQNPFLSIEQSEDVLRCPLTVMPAAGKEYLNRTNIRPGMAETIVNVFKKNGFRVWGGNWNTPIDWQHFQTPRALAKLLAIMVPEDAEILFEVYVQNPNKFNFDNSQDDTLINHYKGDSKKFMERLLSKG